MGYEIETMIHMNVDRMDGEVQTANSVQCLIEILKKI